MHADCEDNTDLICAYDPDPCSDDSICLKEAQQLPKFSPYIPQQLLWRVHGGVAAEHIMQSQEWPLAGMLRSERVVWKGGRPFYELAGA